MNKTNPMQNLKESDTEMYEIMVDEIDRQRYGLEMIPSENFTSLSVMQAMGSVMTNKYSEGYPGKRYYGGNEFIDKAETLAIERAKKLFGAEHANVQPYSGSPANIAVYFGLLEFGDTVLGMSLTQGGHLTHGHKVNYSGKAYNFVQYGVDPETHRIDYEEVRRLALEHKPKIILSGATAYPREIDFQKFAEIAKEVGAISMADISHIAGLVVAGVHPSPFPFTDVVTTTTHKTLRGPRSAIIMCKEEFATKIDKAVFPGLQGGPHDHINAAKAIAFKEAMTDDFKEYAKNIVKNTKALAQSLKAEGIDLVSDGSDNHLLLIDLTKLDLPGKDAELALDQAGIYTNKNTIPFDKRSPFNPSGIRLGTPALTTRGFTEEDMVVVGQLIASVLKDPTNEEVKTGAKKVIREMCEKHPLYPELDLN